MPEASTPFQIVPEDAAAGLAPSISYRGTFLHDRIQPYREVLALEGTTPDLVILFGVGLGYTAAGALLLHPGTRVIAWEPVPGMAAVSRGLLRDEWKVDGRVAIEEDLADFQARLLGSLAGARSAAVVELAALAALEPEWRSTFHAVIRDGVEMVSQQSVAGLDTAAARRLAGALPRFEATPRLSDLEGVLAGQPAVVVTDTPSPEELAAIGNLAATCCVVAAAPALDALVGAGIPVDLAVVPGHAPPPADPRVFGNTVLAVAPEAAPAWWSIPCAGHLALGHNGTAWLFGDDPLSARTTFRWGRELPAVLAALHVGLGPLHVQGLRYGSDASWNLLADCCRRDMLIRRWSRAAGAELRDLPPAGARVPYDAAPAVRFGGLLAHPAGSAPVASTSSPAAGAVNARAAFAALRAETRALAPLGSEAVAAYLARRTGGSPVAAAFVSGAFAGPVADPARALDEAACASELVLRDIVPAPVRAARHPAATDTPVRIFVGAVAGEEIAARVLLAAIERRTSRRLDIRFVLPEIEARLGKGAASLPRAVWPLLVPALSDFEGRALYIEPSALVLGDVEELWDADMADAHAWLPGGGPTSLALFDAARSPWDGGMLDGALASRTEAAAALRPGATGTAELPGAWQVRDEASLAANAVRYTCQPWLPWISDLHPAAWLWEACFDAAVLSGHVSPTDVERAAQASTVRSDLAARARERAGMLPAVALTR